MDAPLSVRVGGGPCGDRGTGGSLMARPVTPEVAYRALEGHDGWVVERHRLYRDFRLGSFTEAISLVDRVAEVAERAGHHPNILVHEWCFVRLELYSHLDGTLSDRDVELAIAIDEMLDDVSGSRAPRRGDARRR
ncbi:MAG: 4a-hydroxytetrahydrobiopterin dehydratase [Chloroflexi bacterium]|nr:MAG: 4a-hydroxytetrahydrobiopterin dehydratase [Chloroflexota bacterium]